MTELSMWFRQHQYWVNFESVATFYSLALNEYCDRGGVCFDGQSGIGEEIARWIKEVWWLKWEWNKSRKVTIKIIITCRGGELGKYSWVGVILFG